MAEVTEQELEEIEALFVQTATGLASNGESLTLVGLAPQTLYFADRPNREVGHLPTTRFVELWDEGDNSFAADPPNAVVSFADFDEAPPEDAVVILMDPQLDGDTINYAVEVLEGKLPVGAGPCTLFIDAFGRPLTPVSAAGIHRRERRRMR
jgi:hypothetical protein